MGARRPKQYLTLGGAPILVHTLRALLRCRRLGGAVLAVPADRIAATRRVLDRHRVSGSVDVIAGGAVRQESVWRGLQAVSADTRWVVVHDAVRPFIDQALVDRVLAAARREGAAICGLPVRETVKRVQEDSVEATVDREGLWLVQTPQAFSRDLLWEAHEKARRDGFRATDDAALVERLGVRVAMVIGLPQNMKITTPDDLRTARRWLSAPRSRTRS
jgi:2-C-methyl-D-erythritol 4-phosphate cytidylyltransferase